MSQKRRSGADYNEVLQSAGVHLVHHGGDARAPVDVLGAEDTTAIFVSARSGEGVAELQARIAELVPSPDVPVELLVPYDRGDVVASLHDRGRILTTEYVDGGTRISAMVNNVDAGGLAEFAVVSA